MAQSIILTTEKQRLRARHPDIAPIDMYNVGNGCANALERDGFFLATLHYSDGVGVPPLISWRPTSQSWPGCVDFRRNTKIVRSIIRLAWSMLTW